MLQKTKQLLSKNKKTIKIKTRKRKVQDMKVGNQVLLHNNTKKRKKGASLKPVFKGP